MDLTTFLDTVTHAGPYALFIAFAFLWWLERDERKESQKRERDLTRELLKSTVKQTNAIRDLRYLFLHGKAPAPEEYEAEDVGE